jgi:signal transduction histidine kinase
MNEPVLEEMSKTERLLQQERARLGAMTTYSHNGTVLIDSGLRLLVINGAALHHLNLSGVAEDWIERSLLDVVRSLHNRNPRAVSQVLEELHRVRSGDDRPSEGMYRGESHVIRWWNLPVHVDKGSLGRLLILRDETASHAVMERQESAADPHHAFDELLTAVAPLVELSALSSGRMPLSPSAFSFSELADRVLEAEQPQAQRRQLSLEHRITHGLPLTWGDRTLIQRVLQHLVAMAIQATPPGGRVWIEANMSTRNSERVKVSIKDTGDPILHRGAGYQPRADGNTEGLAAGLEFAFCRLVIKAHGERMWFSRPPTLGTAVAFTLSQLSESLVDLHTPV